MFVHTASKSTWRSVLAKTPGISYQICWKRGLSNSVNAALSQWLNWRDFDRRVLQEAGNFIELWEGARITISISTRSEKSKCFPNWVCCMLYVIIKFPQVSFVSPFLLNLFFPRRWYYPRRKHCIHIRNIHGYIHIRVSMGTPNNEYNWIRSRRSM